MARYLRRTTPLGCFGISTLAFWEIFYCAWTFVGVCLLLALILWGSFGGPAVIPSHLHTYTHTPFNFPTFTPSSLSSFHLVCQQIIKASHPCTCISLYLHTYPSTHLPASHSSLLDPLAYRSLDTFQTFYPNRPPGLLCYSRPTLHFPSIPDCPPLYLATDLSLPLLPHRLRASAFGHLPFALASSDCSDIGLLCVTVVYYLYRSKTTFAAPPHSCPCNSSTKLPTYHLHPASRLSYITQHAPESPRYGARTATSPHQPRPPPASSYSHRSTGFRVCSTRTVYSYLAPSATPP